MRPSCVAAPFREFMQRGQQQQQQQPANNSKQATAEATPVEPAVDVREIALLLARFACNNHTICDDELRPTGVGLYPLAALVNHHCRPSCVQTFSGRRIVFRCGSAELNHSVHIGWQDPLYTCTCCGGVQRWCQSQVDHLCSILS